ncbi:trafficking protein particle complex subunit 6B, like isoform X3 [Chanos chanos]|uniref:Trafficking protein particle complex subunit 6B, like isoform X3 n=1 Tax=Chanos chanos TaxID=29144 RepID=A0A6J2VR54_CHACN|nr:trafficking protein particle complex subunit 6b-like isoform X3 [Chanos chanos]
MADDALFEFLHMEIVSHVYKEQASRADIDKERVSCVSALESMGFRVGQGLIERFTKDSPTFKDDLDIMKFLCKDFWTNIFRKQVDNLRTNHQFLAFSCGLIRGALSNLGLESVVTAEVSLMPSCKFQVVIQKT